MLPKRIYSVEFLRIFLISSVILCHVAYNIDLGLKKCILDFFHTRGWQPQFAVECFFIIGGFFLYGRLTKCINIHIGANIVNLWIRLMPTVIFCYVILVLSGVRQWWHFPFAFFPSAGYGISTDLVVGCGGWFVGVYFVLSCFFTVVFASTHKSTWLWVSAVVLFCWSTQMNTKPWKADEIYRTYYGFISAGLIRGGGTMGLGLLAAYISQRCNIRKNLLLRVIATVLESVTLYMLFNYMYRRTSVHYNFIAIELIIAFYIVSSVHSWGYISSLLNRCTYIMFVSRYTYSLLIVQGMLTMLFLHYHNFNMKAPVCDFVFFCSAALFVLVEYHLIEKLLVPKLKSHFISTL